MRDFDMVDIAACSFEPLESVLCYICRLRAYWNIQGVADPEVTINVILLDVLDQV